MGPWAGLDEWEMRSRGKAGYFLGKTIPESEATNAQSQNTLSS